MTNFFLCVEKHDIDEIKSLGATYSQELDRWYVDSSQVKLFSKWQPFLANIYANNFKIIKSTIECPYCSNGTDVCNILIEDGYSIDKDLYLSKLDEATNILMDVEFFNWELYLKTIIPNTPESYRSLESSTSSIGRCFYNYCTNCQHILNDAIIFKHNPSIILSATYNNYNDDILVTEVDQKIFAFASPLPLFKLKVNVSSNNTQDSFVSKCLRWIRNKITN